MWCPSMPFVMYHGSKEERMEIREGLFRKGTADGYVYVMYGVL